MTYSVRDVEWIHRTAWADQYAAAPAELVAATGLAVIAPSCHWTQFLLPGVPYRMFNRVLGFGVDVPATEPELDMILQNFATVGPPPFSIALIPGSAPAALPDWLTARGLVFQDEWVLLTHSLATIPEAPPPLTIVPATAQRFGETLCRGYEVPDLLIPWVAALVDRPGWHTYLACDGATPVGAGAFYRARGLAWFGPAATLPEARGRGAQSALFAHRLAQARAHGCHLAVTEALPGSASHRNMLRAGFVERYHRRNIGPEKG